MKSGRGVTDRSGQAETRPPGQQAESTQHTPGILQAEVMGGAEGEAGD